MYHHSGNIVFAAIGVCQVNQCITDFLRASWRAERLDQVLRSHHLPQAIRAKQQCVPPLQGLLKNVHFDRLKPGPQRTILGESYKFAIAQQVGAAIADVSNVGRFVLYQSGSNSASESTGSGMLFTMPQDGVISVLDRLSKLALNCQRHRRIRQLTRLLWLHNFGGSYLFYGFQFNRRISQFKQVEFDGWLLINRDEEAPQPFADLLYGKLTGHFASLVAAHTVSHDKETTVPILR